MPQWKYLPPQLSSFTATVLGVRNRLLASLGKSGYFGFKILSKLDSALRGILCLSDQFPIIFPKPAFSFVILLVSLSQTLLLKEHDDASSSCSFTVSLLVSQRFSVKEQGTSSLLNCTTSSLLLFDTETPSKFSSPFCEMYNKS